jgi:hypothetical protein
VDEGQAPPVTLRPRPAAPADAPAPGEDVPVSDQRSLERDATPGERIALTVADRFPGLRRAAAGV